MNAIVAVDENWGIGKNNNLLFRIPEDQKFFREKTIGKIIVIGRNTLNGFPGGLLLKDRTNIVLTHDASFKPNGLVVVHSVPELLNTLKNYNDDDVFVVGGGNVYRQLIDKCEAAFVTKVSGNYGADTFFPCLDKIPGWRLIDTKAVNCDGQEVEFCTYVKPRLPHFNI